MKNKRFDRTKNIKDGYLPIYLGYTLTMVNIKHTVNSMKALQGFCVANCLNYNKIAKLQGGYYFINNEHQWEFISRTLGFLTFSILFEKLKNK